MSSLMKKRIAGISVAFVLSLFVCIGATACNQQKSTSPEMDTSDFVLISDVVPDVIQEIRYHSTYNFVGDRINGYEEPVSILTKEAANALKEVSDELKQKGYRLKVYDAYRPQMAVDNFVS